MIDIIFSLATVAALATVVWMLRTMGECTRELGRVYRGPGFARLKGTVLPQQNLVLTSINGHRRDHGYARGLPRTPRVVRPVLIVNVETGPQHA